MISLLAALVPKDIRRELDRAPTTLVTHEQQVMSLSDGSIVKVDPGTDLTVAFTPTQRRVYLASGQAMFNVTRDPRRPFAVLTPAIRIEAIGTRFTVSLYERQFTVAVAEGSVRLTAHGDDPEQALALTLTAGQLYTAPKMPLAESAASSMQPGSNR